MLLSLNQIRLDGGTQPRSHIDYDTVDDYADLMQAGAKFPKLTVFYDGTDYWLADGFHRIKSALQNNLEKIDCDVQQGTLQDAQWSSFAANKSHGLRRTNEDKQRAVKAALEHPKGAKLSDKKIASHVGVDPQTVANWRSKLTTEIRQSSVRTGKDGRTIDTSKIGKKKSKVTKKSADPSPEPLPLAARSVVSAFPPTEENTGIRYVEDDTPIQEEVVAKKSYDEQWADAVVEQITILHQCPVHPETIARIFRAHTDAKQLIKTLESVREFCTEVLAAIPATAAA